LSGGSIDGTVMVRDRRSGRGLRPGQRHGMDRLGTCEIPLASMREHAGTWAAG